MLHYLAESLFSILYTSTACYNILAIAGGPNFGEPELVAWLDFAESIGRRWDV